MQNQTDSMCRGDIFHILYVLSENSEWLLHFSTSGYSQSDIIDMPALMKIHLKSYENPRLNNWKYPSFLSHHKCFTFKILLQLHVHTV